MAYWSDAEGSASPVASASCYSRSEDVRVTAVILPELKFVQVEREIFLADIVIRPDDPALQQSPEGLDIVGVNLTANILALRVLDGLMTDAAPKVVVALVLVRRDKRDLLIRRRAERIRPACERQLAPMIRQTTLPLRSIAPITPTLP